MWLVNQIYPKLVQVKFFGSGHDLSIRLDSLAFVGSKHKLTKVISVESNVIWLECLESESELRLKDEVKFYTVEDITHLQPSYFGQAINLLGKVISPQSREVVEANSWDFIPVVQNGERIVANQKIGYCQIHDHLKFWLLSNQSGQVRGIAAGKCNFDSNLTQINSIDQFFHTSIDYSNLSLSRHLQKPFVTSISTLDLLYPILIGSCNRIHNPPKRVFQSFLQSASIDITIVINTKFQGNLPFNTIQLVDTFNQANIMIQSAYSLAKQLMTMGYKVLIWNNLPFISCVSCVKWNCGLGETMESEEFGLTVVDTVNNYQTYDNTLSFADEKLQFDSSFLEDDIENYLSSIGNIQYLTDFKTFHSKVTKSQDLQELLNLKTDLTLESLHQLVNSKN